MISVRLALPTEFTRIGELTVAAYRHLEGGASLGDYEVQLRDAEARARDSDVLIAVESDGHILGSVTYVPDATREMSEFDDTDAAGIRMLAVDPPFQGRGAARRLVEACISRARDAQRRRLVLHSTDTMVIAQGLYRQLGFQLDPTHDIVISPEYSGRPDGLRLSAYVLTL